MNLFTKIAPLGIDSIVEQIQDTLNLKLPTWTDFNCYPRVYKEETSTGIKPMYYKNNGDYVDVFLNDNIDGNCFFYDADTMTSDNGYFNKIALSIVFQIDLVALYPNVLHRADEEAHNDVIVALKKLPLYKITNIVKGIRNVYSEFAISQVQLDDINKYHVFRVDLECLVEYNCCSNC